MIIKTNKGTLETSDGIAATLSGSAVNVGLIRHMKRALDGWECMAMLGKETCVLLFEADAAGLLKLRVDTMPDGAGRIAAIGDLMAFNDVEGQREDEADVRDAARRRGHPSIAAWTQARGGTA